MADGDWGMRNTANNPSSCRGASGSARHTAGRQVRPAGTARRAPTSRRRRHAAPAAEYIWGGSGDWQCLEERDGSGDLVARYTYAPGYIDAVVVQERDLNDDQDFADTNEVTYYLTNPLFNVYALADANESVIERYQYDAYGSCTVLDTDGSDDADGLSDVLNPYLFTGRRLDAESGLMQYRNRYYSTALGRFLERDGMQYKDGFNLYQYAQGRPSVFLDPDGYKVAVRRRYKHMPFAEELRIWHCYIRVDWTHKERIPSPEDPEEEDPQEDCDRFEFSEEWCTYEIAPTDWWTWYEWPNECLTEVKMTCSDYTKQPQSGVEAVVHYAAIYTPPGRFHFRWNNCCHWARRVWERAGQTWPYPSFNWGVN